MTKPQGPVSKRAPIMERLLARRTVTAGGCWLYNGTLAQGYGLIGYKGRLHKVHRLARELLVGPIPAGQVCDHVCHNEDPTCKGGPTCEHRRCFNPAHSPPVAKVVNDRSGRQGAYLAERTHCPARHPYAEFGVSYPSSKGVANAGSASG